jgi:hypothetical protein
MEEASPSSFGRTGPIVSGPGTKRRSKCRQSLVERAHSGWVPGAGADEVPSRFGERQGAPPVMYAD